MFTGLIRSLGTVTQALNTPAGLRLGVMVDGGVAALGSIRLGDSISVNGCCLTAVELDRERLQFDVIPQSLSMTTIGAFAVGRRVHLERALLVGEPLGGHIVQGHIDGTGTVLHAGERGGYRISVSVDPAHRRWLLDRGSIALDGVSLTLAHVDQEAGTLEVALIPETLHRTLLASLRPGDLVNLEFDQLAKAIVSRLAAG